MKKFAVAFGVLMGGVLMTGCPDNRISGASPFAPASSNVAGYWTGYIVETCSSVTFYCSMTISQGGTSLTAPLDVNGSVAFTMTGSIAGNAVSMSYSSAGNTFALTGTLSGNTLNGPGTCTGTCSCSTWNWSMTRTTPPTPTPTNPPFAFESPVGTINGPTVVSGDTSSASDNGLGCGSGPDHLYLLNVTGAPRQYTFSTCSGAAWDTEIGLYDQGGNMIDCDDDSCSLQSTIVWTFASNGTYYLFVDGFGGDYGPYTLTVTSP